MDKNARIYVAGHQGLVGSALVGALLHQGYQNLITVTRAELDLTDQAATLAFFQDKQPEYVFLAAAKVGGIGANSAYPADFIAQNLSIALNVIQASYQSGVNKLCNLGSSCIYPKYAEQPMREAALLTGELEPTNEPYAIAKIAAIKLCTSFNEQYQTDFLSLMPTNLYGPGDNYDKEAGHVLPALIAKFHDAKTSGASQVVLWGDGSPLREFLYVDDLADAALFLMQQFSAADIGQWINVGSGQEVSISDLAMLVRDVVFGGDVTDAPAIVWDSSKPNGTPRKLLDTTRINNLGWRAQTSLQAGVRQAYDAYRQSLGSTL